MSLSKNMVWSPSEYEQASVLAREVGEEMLARLDWMTVKPTVIVDAGCGTGEISLRLHERYPDAEIVAVDTSDAMLQYAKKCQPVSSHFTHHCADAASLPLADETVDLVFANFLLPWHHNVPALLREWRRVLRPDGLIMLSALGPDTLREWQTLLSGDEIPQLVDMHDVGDALLQEGFADPVLDVNYFTMTYRCKDKLINELHASGMLATQSESLDLNQIEPLEDGSWPITYEVIYGHAFAPAKSDEISASADGVVRVPLAHLRQKMRAK